MLSKNQNLVLKSNKTCSVYVCDKQNGTKIESQSIKNHHGCIRHKVP